MDFPIIAIAYSRCFFWGGGGVIIGYGPEMDFKLSVQSLLSTCASVIFSVSEVPKLSFGSSAKRSLSQSELLHKRIRALADSDDHNPSRSRRRPIRIRRVGSNLSNYSRKSTEDEANSFLMDSIVPSKGRTDVSMRTINLLKIWV